VNYQASFCEKAKISCWSFTANSGHFSWNLQKNVCIGKFFELAARFANEPILNNEFKHA